MIFYDITLVVGENTTLEYDKSGGIIEKQFSLANMSIAVSEDKLGKITIIKDPVLNHVNIYVVEFFDLPIEIINLFKSNLVSYILIRMGSQVTNGIKDFNLYKLSIKPITLMEHAVQNDKILNDLVVKGISLTANALILDSDFGKDLDIVKDDAVRKQITVKESSNSNNSNKNWHKDYTPMDPSKTLRPMTGDPHSVSSGNINIRTANAGNIKWWLNHTPWPGQTGYITTTSKVTGEKEYFMIFDSYENGAAASLALLTKYIAPKGGDKPGWGKETAAEVIMTWAPPSDGNDTEAYIRNVSAKAGLDRNKKLTKDDLLPLFKAMTIHEGDTSNVYTNEILNRAAEIVGINSRLPKSGYANGSGNTPKGNIGTNVNKLINSFANIQGFTLLSTFLQKMKEKYEIDIDGNSSTKLIKSNFMYKNISLPAVSTLELLKKIHKDYPAYYANVPWILDDAKPTMDINKVGKTIYTEINILSINSLEFKTLNQIYGGNPTASVPLTNKDTFRQFYTESLDRIESKNIIFKDMTNGVETSFKAKASNEVALVPDNKSSTNLSEGVKQIKISSGETIQMEALYDAPEFEKRYELFKNHVKTNPQLIRIEMHSDNPMFIDFGYAYTFSELDLNKVTPYKIKMEFQNINNTLKLTYLIDFYKGVDVVTI